MRMTRCGYNVRSLSLSERRLSFLAGEELRALDADGGEKATTEEVGEAAWGSVDREGVSRPGMGIPERDSDGDEVMASTYERYQSI